jgi:hypothetical protein
VYAENEALEEIKSWICCVVNVVIAANVYAFCLRASKDSSMGEFDKSILIGF